MGDATALGHLILLGPRQHRPRQMPARKVATQKQRSTGRRPLFSSPVGSPVQITTPLDIPPCGANWMSGPLSQNGTRPDSSTKTTATCLFRQIVFSLQSKEPYPNPLMVCFSRRSCQCQHIVSWWSRLDTENYSQDTCNMGTVCSSFLCCKAPWQTISTTRAAEYEMLRVNLLFWTFCIALHLAKSLHH